MAQMAKIGRGSNNAAKGPFDITAQIKYCGDKDGLHKGGLNANCFKSRAAVDRRTIVKGFEAVEACMSPDLLSRAVASLSVSPEVYLSMRSQFARSLASLTACAHVLGIGDRHLDNFLLSTATGRVVGIDFGHSFGSATYLLPVPELMGVRLTRQLTSFLAPLDTSVLLKGHMAITFEALRNRRSELMRLMEVFLSEPIVDWETQTRKLSAEQRRRLEAEAEETEAAAGTTTQADGGMMVEAEEAPPASLAGGGRASRAGKSATVAASTAGGGGGGSSARLTKGWAQLRLSTVSAKLQGGNSACLTMKDLESNAAAAKDATMMGYLRDVVMGPSDSLRRSLPESGLTAAQQVDVLVEQATDLNILGRTYQGWSPWL